MKNAIKVLIVDDDRSSNALLSEVVKRMGFKVVSVTKPADALNAAKLQTVQAAVIDVLLPKMSGVDLAVEMRKTRFAESPVIFVSGIFKDKSFAAEALKKAGAVDFLFKPFGAEDLTKALNGALASVLSVEKWTVQSLLVRKLSSARERAKAIESLEVIRGQEFPFVLSILMEAKVSGHLNIVSDSGEIFGITLNAGAITEVDSADSREHAIQALIAMELLAQEDWEKFQASKGAKFTLEDLVEDGVVSPHAVDLSKQGQILTDLKAICSAASMQVNFAPTDDAGATPQHAVVLHAFLRMLLTSLEEFFPEGYLEEFYAPVLEAPIQLRSSPEDFNAVWERPTFEGLTELRSAVESGETLGTVLSRSTENKRRIYSALHFLVLNRWIIFDDINKAKSLSSLLERYRKLHDQLKDKTPDKIFFYFGAKQNLGTMEVEKIYQEFVRSNDPTQLPKGAPQELVDLCKSCYQLVSKAHEILVDETKRAQLFQSLKTESAEKLKKSNELTARGLELLRKGQFQGALEALDEAGRTHPTTMQFLIQVWARIKAGTLTAKPQLLDVHKKLEELPMDDRRTAYYFMALGEVKKTLGDVAAQGCFERVLQMDSSFGEARRELSTLANTKAAKENKKLDLFTGDITEIVSQLFRRKAE